MKFNKSKNKLTKLKETMFMWILIFGVLATALMPTWIYLLARYLFNPDNALVEIILFGLVIYVMGLWQIIFLVLAAIIIFHIWNEF